MFETKIQTMVDKSLSKYVTAKVFNKFTETIEEKLTTLISEMQMKQITLTDQVNVIDN